MKAFQRADGAMACGSKALPGKCEQNNIEEDVSRPKSNHGQRIDSTSNLDAGKKYRLCYRPMNDRSASLHPKSRYERQKSSILGLAVLGSTSLYLRNC